MDKCLFCKKIKPIIRPKFCSVKCVKRAWHLRRNPNSYFGGSSDFWASETGIGFKWEKYAAKILGAKHLEFNNGGADLDWNGKLIDVKSSKINKRKNKRGKPVLSEQAGNWSFARGKYKPINFFFCIALLNDKPYKIYLIPNNKFPKSGITVGWKSIYDKFIF